MESLSNHLSYNLPDYYSVDSFLRNNRLTVETVSQSDLNWYARYICEGRYWTHRIPDSAYDIPPEKYIQEMLRSISIGKLKDVLNCELGGNRKQAVTIISDNIDGLQSYELRIPLDMYDYDALVEICDRMMWLPTKVHNAEEDFYIVTVEPQYADNVTEYVKNNCSGKLYHLVGSKRIFDSIMRSGLRMKGENNTYRLMKNKVFFVCGKDMEQLKNNIKTVAISKHLWDYDRNRLKINTFVIKADVSSYNVNFYDDAGYNDKTKSEREGIVYSYAYFPPKILRDVTKEIKSLWK